MKNTFLVYAIIAVLAVGGGAFYGGMKYRETRLKKGFNGQRPGAGMMGARNGGSNNKNGNNFIGGSIISKDDKSITVKTQDGSTKTVYFSNSTTIAKADKGTSADLVVGQEINANGTSNSDGSVAASNIQIRQNQ